MSLIHSQNNFGSVLAVISSTEVALFGLSILAAFFLIFGLFWFFWWVSRKEASASPYTGLPLRRATDLSYNSMERVLRFLYDLHQYDNRLFEFRKAALCRETGRIFPNCITWFDTIKLDWTFILKRYPGHYVSWGSLTEAQKDSLRKVHESLEQFQTEFSSTEPSPRHVEPQYAYEKPGPLYVDVDTGVLVGWVSVPDTELEVLIVQKPTQIITISVTKD